MAIVTIEGRVGAGAPELGRKVARELDIDFVDRLILAEVAKKVNATMRALVDQERRVPSLIDRLAMRVQRVLERSAVAGMGGDPYFGPGVEDLISRQYTQYEEEPHTTAEEVDDQRFIETTREVIADIAEQGNVLILSRGGGAILRERADVLRVGVVARREDRVQRVSDREGISHDEADEFITHSDIAQHRYFEKAFESSPIDPFLYHFMWNTSDVGVDFATEITVDAARSMDDHGLRDKPAEETAS